MLFITHNRYACIQRAYFLISFLILFRAHRHLPTLTSTTSTLRAVGLRVIFTYKIERDLHREWTYSCLDTMLYLKWITNKDLLYSTWNSAQCFLAAGWERSLGENGHMYTCSCVPSQFTETITYIVNQLCPNTK